MTPSTDEAELRELTTMRYPYKAYFRMSNDEILILNVRYGRRAPWKGKG